jgi:PAN domain
MLLYVVLIIVLFLILCNKKQENNGNIPNNEAVQNLASMYNSGKVKTNKIQLGDKWILSGVGDNFSDDNWLRLMSSQDPTKYKGGIAADELYINNNAHIIKKLITKDITSSGNIEAAKLKVNNPEVYETKFDTSQGDIRDRKTQGLTQNDMINICRALPGCDRFHIGNNGGQKWVWFKGNNSSDIIWHKNFPDNFYVLAASTAGYINISSAPSTDLNECKQRCKDNNSCKFIQLQTNNMCWLRSDANGTKKTYFINKNYV